ncbi:LOW QUALITY PROTEIN: uncharacterized protein LOC113562253 [Ooceraea biroi]|uniref:LOW QUALITY PROTEIN: uncharacterized protein LOC113562253 n=1 Tax=Ooceraea biroi TaxID=2015173 RepID=UPI000F08B9C5|nr:LOW QUALITY PROTEIN: uncharacterized protein LOC113562253 [Ooceraea biroi]
MLVMIIKADDSRRDLISFNAETFAPSRKSPRNFLLDQLFIDKIIEQRGSTIVPVRDQFIGQRVPHAFSKDRDIVYPSGLPIYHRQPFKQTPSMLTTLKGDPLFVKSRESRGQRATLRENPFERQSSPFASSMEVFGGRAHKTRTPLKQQLFMAETPLRNLFHGQSSSGERASFQKQAVLDDPPLPHPMRFYRDDPYDKPIDSYGRQRDAQTSPYEDHPPMHTEYDNDMPPSMPMILSSENLVSRNVGMFTTPSSVSIVTDKPGFSISTSSGNDEVHSSEASKMKRDPASDSAPSSMQADGNCNVLVDSSPSVSSRAATTVPSISVNQSSIVGHILTSLTTKPSSPVMATATPITSFVGNTPKPVYFHATKYGAVMTPSIPAENGLKSVRSESSLAQAPTSDFKSDESNLKYLVSEAVRNNLKTDTKSPILSYILDEGFKGNRVQSSLAKYTWPKGLKYDWSLQHFSQPDMSSGYAPLSLDGKASLALPSVSRVVPISAISWPVKSERDISAILPVKTITASGVTTSHNLPLGMANSIPLHSMASIPSSLTPSLSNSISGITADISTAIPDGMAVNIPASIPTLNFEEDLHREHLRAQEARNPWYSGGISATLLMYFAGLQLQLGGFGGINYTLHTSNPAVRPTESLGIVEADLTPPKLPWQAPALAKVSSRGTIASFAAPALATLESLRNDDVILLWSLLLAPYSITSIPFRSFPVPCTLSRSAVLSSPTLPSSLPFARLRNVALTCHPLRSCTSSLPLRFISQLYALVGSGHLYTSVNELSKLQFVEWTYLARYLVEAARPHLRWESVQRAKRKLSCCYGV